MKIKMMLLGMVMLLLIGCGQDDVTGEDQSDKASEPVDGTSDPVDETAGVEDDSEFNDFSEELEDTKIIKIELNASEFDNLEEDLKLFE